MTLMMKIGIQQKIGAISCATLLLGIGAVAENVTVVATKAAAQERSERVEQNVLTEEPNRGGDLTLDTQDPQLALERLHVAEGYEVSLFASEKEFPIGNAVSITFDARGRLWVLTMPSYPQRLPGVPPDDKLIILEDTDGDGRADRHTVFLDKLHVPTGFELGDGGAYVAQQPNVIFAADTDGDDVADVRRTVLHGFGSEDSHHSISAFTWGPGGAIYMHEGRFFHTQVETPYGAVRCFDGGTYRYEPRTHRVQVHVSYNYHNPWGHVFDRWGQNFIADASDGSNYFALPLTTHIDYPKKHPTISAFTSRVRPTSGCEFVRSRHFPESAQGNFLINNCIGFNGIKQHRMIEEGSGFTSEEVEPLLFSSDVNFRPVDLQFGPDGALYVVDWWNPLVGHMQYSLRDPRRDHQHGRIWRITYKGNPLLIPLKVAGEPIPALLELLKVYEDRVRYRARRELREHEPTNVVAALAKWITELDPSHPVYENHMLEALWLYQSMNVIEPDLLRRMLRSEDYHARAAATRALRYWSDRIEDPLALLRVQVGDKHPRVRLEAIAALSHFHSAEAAEIALEALNHSMDYYLEYGLRETVAALEKYWKPSIASGKPFAADNPAGLRYVLGRIPPADLLSAARSEPIFYELLTRPGVEEKHRAAALAGLANLRKTDEQAELLSAIEEVDSRDENASDEVLRDLARILAGRPWPQLRRDRRRIERLATSARRRLARQAGYVGLMAADGSVEPAWQLAVSSSGKLRDLVEAVPLITDEQLRSSLYPKIRPLLDGSVDSQRIVRRAAISAISYLPGHDVETFVVLSKLVSAGVERAGAIRSLRRLPRSGLPEDEVRRLASSVVAHVAEVPVDQRTTPAVLDALQFGKELAALLPDADAKQIVAELRDLEVRVITIRTVPHKMLYDMHEIAVEAGKPVEIVFENTDIMPHNLLIAAPGALAEVGQAAERMQTSPDAASKHFVPELPTVLHATKMLQTREIERLRFVAPEVPDDYPFLCTFPGHWLRMNGVMHVVEDVDQYLKENPLPEPLVLAEVREFVREWTMEDLVGNLSEVDSGRSFEQGAALFAAASCSACHRMGNVGGLTGPNLVDLDAKITRLDILSSIVEPSKTIKDEFRSHVILTKDGVQVTGMIVGQDDDAISIIESPLIECEPKRISRDSVELNKESTVSMMPEGLLNTLSAEEILDLLAYLESRGNPQHPLYKK